MEQEEIRFLIISASAILFLLILVILGIVSYVQKKKVQFILDRERSKAAYEEELLNSQVEISNQSLRNISWELHDNVGQILSVASLQTKKMLSKEKVERGDVEELQELIGTSIKEIRALSKTLNHEVLGKLGIIEALKVELDRLERLNILKYEFDHPDFLDLSKDQTVLLFRILQEFISNVVKHAQATHLVIELKEDNDKLIVLAQDNGKGYDTTLIESNNGLINMRSRAKLMKAEFDITSNKGVGTILKMSLPYQTEYNG